MKPYYEIKVDLYQATFLFNTIIDLLPNVVKQTKLELVKVLDDLRSAIEILEEQEELKQ